MAESETMMEIRRRQASMTPQQAREWLDNLAAFVTQCDCCDLDASFFTIRGAQFCSIHTRVMLPELFK